MARNPAEEFAKLRDEVEALRSVVDERLADDPIREQAFEKLYEELRSYKDDFAGRAERPLLLDLLLFHDSMHWFQKAVIEEGASAATIADSFQFLLDELLEVLYRREVVPMEPGESFDPTVQKAVKVEPAKSPGQDNRVARVLKRGFLQHGKPLRPEEVAVFKWKGGRDDT